MMTLRDYAAKQFPDHRCSGTTGELGLTSHTTIAHFVSADTTAMAEHQMRNRFHEPGAVGTVFVEPVDDSLTAATAGDQDSSADVPRTRVATGGVLVGALIGAVAGVLVGVLSRNVAAGVVVGVFVALSAGWIGGLVAGGGRYAGERAWNAPHAPGQVIGLVAVFTQDEVDAVEAATLLAELDPHDLRVVDQNGAWHLPNTFA